ncbi:MAG: prepilin peptidase [Rhodospirillales bacterium]
MLNVIPFPHILIASFAALLVAAAVWDVRTFTIPNRLNLAMALLFPVYAFSVPQPVDWLWTAVIASIVFAGGLGLFALNALGGGDVKMLAAVSLWAGPTMIFDFLIVTALAGGAMAVLLTARSRSVAALALGAIGKKHLRESVLEKPMPYGIAIAAGGLAVAVKSWPGTF